MEIIKNFNKTKLHVDSHAEFNLSVLKVLKEAVFTNAEMVALIGLYENSIELEANIIARPRASIYTPPVQNNDESRGAMLRQVISTIKYARKSTIPAMREAGENLWIMVKPYRNIYTKPMTDETEAIRHLLKVLGSSDEVIDWIDALSLPVIVQEMRKINNKFSEKYNERSVERGSLAGKGITTSEQRKVVDNIYMQIVNLLNSVVVATRSGIDTGFPQEILNTVTLDINSYINQYKLVLSNQGKKRKTESNEENIDIEDNGMNDLAD
ncbi:DUF6261 family protein [Bacteroides sp. OttesenSCG-928-D19]|nr:DUF6261 family protein [Bacteroides sp. OttesenSCG-928-D19]